MRVRRPLRLAGLLPLLLLAGAGCWSPPAPSIQEYDRGLIWLFPGVEGGAWLLAEPYRAMRDAGVSAAIRCHEWTPLLGTFENLTSLQRNRYAALQTAAWIAEYSREHPQATIDLVGYSGGGGMAVLVAEALPPETPLRNVVLVQAAISPDYDLTAVLRRVRGQVVNLHAPLDWLILGAGTRTFGTLDRKYTPSAGKDGFDLAKAVPDESLRPRLVQRAWTAGDVLSGHTGMHGSIFNYTWNQRIVAPYLKPR